MKRYPTTLIIAGSDSCGGAGIQADIKTCSAIGVYATTAITAVTAQNTMGVIDIQAISPHMVHRQIEAVIEDFTIDCIKIGMLCNAHIANAVADALSRIEIPIVLDPVMVSTSGHKLLSDDAIEVVVERLFPMASLITPNTHEASLITGIATNSLDDMLHNAQLLLQKGCKAVLMKGGHIDSTTATDILVTNEHHIEQFSSERINTRNTHGTGCTLASAIAAYMALGFPLSHAIKEAKNYLTGAIAHSADVQVGHGHGALNHAFAPQPLQTLYNK
ncbi:MAG: bifunctional hydroxymethylpyrimidine kinase/phosphomethylpyrimidine kinase [Bacteroidaceae bacterium]|nr:bifunctional hydroxymethylpyrimidine kinase/phosphomethylpyrimidine kinase [Bacteroidaceae bacterium]MBQ2979519.1 bifunctional hydroxymethylpyrimidine kinase/phosphomethylpyrimidine kinase [Bacteroidaceae bacterium]